MEIIIILLIFRADWRNKSSDKAVEDYVYSYNNCKNP